jgi:ribosomal protein S18 acetylase RimI-like enzyme
MNIRIRDAGAGDGAALHAIVRELAVHHGHADDFVSSPMDFELFLAGPNPVGGALIATCGDAPAGCAIWHRSFSTFRGRETLYLEDLAVLPQYRRRGIGSELLKAVARLACGRGLPAVTWLVMDWNEEARRLYAAAGAEIESGNSVCRLSGAALERLGS